MSVMSDLDLLYREGAVTVNDFIERGVSPERAEAYAGIVAERDYDVLFTQRLETRAKRLAKAAKNSSFIRKLFGLS